VKYWSIKTFLYGQTQSPRAALSYGLDPELSLPGPYLGFLLQNGTENILVDTGVSDRIASSGKGWSGNQITGGSKFVLEELEKAGLVPDDIDTVIYTHLHNDHAGNVTMFPNARTIFQKDEYINLLNPLPTQCIRKDYELEVADDLKQLKDISMVNGDFDLPNGIRLIKTPGHSLGSQAILVPTEDGSRIITGDMPHKMYNLFPQMDYYMMPDGSHHPITPAPESWGRYLPNSLIYDHYAFYDSMDKLRLLAPTYEPKCFLPGHDWSCMIRYPNK